MTFLLPLFLAIQALIVALAGWQVTGACLVLDAFAMLLATVESVRRQGVAGTLRWVAVRLDAAAFAWERARAAYSQSIEPAQDCALTGIEREMGGI